MQNVETLNGVVTQADIFIEDHGIWTSIVHIDHEGGSQGFGGYFLSGEAMRLWIIGVCQVLGVSAWSMVTGKHCRVLSDHCRIHALGNIVEDKWFKFERVLDDSKNGDGPHHARTVNLLNKRDILTGSC